MSRLVKILSSQKGVSHLVILVVVVIGIAAGLYLVSRETDITPSADDYASCDNFVLKYRICGQDAYTDCTETPICKMDPETGKAIAYYVCKASPEQNPNCVGEIRCEKDDYMCAPNISSSTSCAAGNTQTITVNWKPDQHVNERSYNVSLMLLNADGTVSGGVGGAKCVTANDANNGYNKATNFYSYTFPRNYEKNSYKVIVTSYEGYSCAGQPSLTKEAPVTNADSCM